MKNYFLFIISFAIVAWIMLLSSIASYAAWPGDCQAILEVRAQVSNSTDIGVHYSSTITINPATGAWRGDAATGGQTWYNQGIHESYYFEGTTWFRVHTYTGESKNRLSGVSELPTGCPGQCDGPGEETYEEALGRCAFEEKELSFYDEEICKGYCGSCDEAALAAKVAECPYGAIAVDYINCTAECRDCTTDADECVEQCGGEENIDKFTCSSDETGLVSDCQCLEPPDNDCNDRFNACAAKCGGSDNIASFTCNDPVDGPVTSDCECIAPPPPEPPTPPVDPPEEPPVDPPEEPPVDNPENPDDLNNGWLKAIKQNTDKIVSQNNDRSDQLSNIGKNLYVLAADQKSLIKETRYVADSVNYQGDRIVDAIEDIELNIDLSTLEKNTKDTADNTKKIADSLAVDEGYLSGYEQSAKDIINNGVNAEIGTMQDEVMSQLNSVESVNPDDAGYFKNLIVSILPESTTCQPIDLSFANHELIIGCERSDDVKQLLSYLVYVLTVVAVFTMIHKELVPKN